MNKIISTEGELQELNRQLVKNFRAGLQQQQANKLQYEKFVQEPRWWTDGFTTYQLVKQDFTFRLDKLVICPYGYYQINYEEVAKFIQQIEATSRGESLRVYQQQLEHEQNGYLAIIAMQEAEHRKRTGDLKTDLNRKTEIMTAAEIELAKLTTENQDLKEELAELQEKLEPFMQLSKQRTLNLARGKQNRKKTIQSKEYADLGHAKEAIAELSGQLTAEQEMSASLQATRVSLEARLRRLENKEKNWEREREQSFAFYAKVEKNRAEEKAERAEQTSKLQQLSREKVD